MTATPNTPDEAEELAELIASLTGLELEDCAIIERKLRESMATGLSDEEAVGAALPEIAEELGRAQDGVARSLAEAETLARQYDAWKRRVGIDEYARDTVYGREQARLDLEAASRRREKLEAKIEMLAGSTAHASIDKRRRYELELELLERRENEYWRALHDEEEMIGSPWSREPGEPAEPREKRFCCPVNDCGAELTQNRQYTHGRCERCVREFELIYKRPFPVVG